MSQLSYQRAYELSYLAVDGTSRKLTQTLDKIGLMIDFEVEKTTSSEPNQATVGITNPSEETIAIFQKDGILSLKCGYHSNINLQPDIAEILVGSRDDVSYEDNGSDKRIEILVKEGAASYDQLQFQNSYSFGISVQEIVSDLVNHLIANVRSVESANEYTLETFKTYQFPQVFDGNAYSLLKDILAGIDYEYFINKGVLTILKRNGFTRELEVLVNANNGMIGSPKSIVEVDDARNAKTGIEIQSILNYNFDAGRRIKVQSRDFQDRIFKIESVNFSGNSYEGSWLSNIKAYEFNE